jgi:hypothetical protein
MAKNGTSYAMRGKQVCCLLVFALMGGCVQPQSSYRPPVQSFRPAQDTSIRDVSFRQLIQPAFASDYAGKNVRFDAVFYSLFNEVMDLPSKYKQGYIRLYLCSTFQMGTLGDAPAPVITDNYVDVVIPKSKSGPVFDLQPGQKLRIVAYALPTDQMSAVSLGGQKRLLLVVDSFEKVGQ